MIEVLAEVAKEGMQNLKEISFKEINQKISPSELLDKLDEYGISADSKEIDDIKDEVSNIEKINKGLPRENGEWSGERGDSTWKPDREMIPQKFNENNKTWGEILDSYKTDGIKFKDGEPDFLPVSKETVKIDDFSPERNQNKTQADENLAKQWNDENKDAKQWSPHDIKDYRKENDLTWHERSDMKTIDLVPQEVHGNISHRGGISVIKDILNKNNQKVV